MQRKGLTRAARLLKRTKRRAKKRPHNDRHTWRAYREWHERSVKYEPNRFQYIDEKGIFRNVLGNEPAKVVLRHAQKEGLAVTAYGRVPTVEEVYFSAGRKVPR